MGEDSSTGNAGAPLRMFLVFMACWIIGRTIWALFAPEPFAEAGNPSVTQNATKEGSFPVRARELPPVLSTKSRFPPAADLVFSRLPVANVSTQAARPVPEVQSSPDIRMLPVLPVLAPQPDEGNEATAPGYSPFLASAPKTPVQWQREPPESESHDLSDSWTGYAWILARQGSSGFAPTAPVRPGDLSGAQYGASQAGLQIAYRISGDRSRQIAATVRASTALETGGDEELALGGRIKPIAGLPIALHAEQRFNLKSVDPRGTAIFLAGGTGPHPLPAGFAFESWGQGGYVFGARDTWFYDGSVSLRREIARPESGALTVGTSLWAGGQKDATRIDAGPRASFLAPVGSGHARLDLDWRQRIAGNAQPGSGLTLTISTGF